VEKSVKVGSREREKEVAEVKKSRMKTFEDLKIEHIKISGMRKTQKSLIQTTDGTYSISCSLCRILIIMISKPQVMFVL